MKPKHIEITFFLKIKNVTICNNTVFEAVKKYVKIAKNSIIITLKLLLTNIDVRNNISTK